MIYHSPPVATCISLNECPQKGKSKDRFTLYEDKENPTKLCAQKISNNYKNTLQKNTFKKLCW